MKYVEHTSKGTKYTYPISGKVWERSIGDILCPERFPELVIAGYKKNPRVWAGQYQQRPSPAGGYIFPTESWRFYRERPDLEIQILSVDAAFKARPENDLVALHVYGVDGGNRFLFDRRTEHLDEPNTEKAILDMRAKWPKISYVLIEDKANGPAIISRLSSIMPGLIAINPEGGKESRAHAAAADVYSGNVYLPDPEIYTWVQPLIDHFASYNGEGSVEHDDDEDAFSQFINWARGIFSGVGSWIDKEYERIKEGEKLGGLPSTRCCPVCHGDLSYMSGVWFCPKGCARGNDNTGRCTRVGF